MFPLFLEPSGEQLQVLLLDRLGSNTYGTIRDQEIYEVMCR